MRLVADVGGTHIRLGLVGDQGKSPANISKVRSADFDSLETALISYTTDNSAAGINEACIAVAGPVNEDRVKLTNLPWEFSQTALQRALGVNKLAVINDFAAVAMAIPYLNAGDCTQVGVGTAEHGLPIAAVGPGTGLGAAMLVAHGLQYNVIATEAGHAAIAAETDIEHAIVKHFAADGSHIKREFFLSGSGLKALHSALSALQSAQAPELSPAEIQQRACAGSDALCEQALNIFCGWLGGACADLALSCGARGGVYIGGGMVKKFLNYFAASDFRQRFENRAAMRGYLQAIPTYVITREHCALLGAGNAAING
ncbi:MAG: glucokinase [Pseudomonadales bacterium]